MEEYKKDLTEKLQAEKIEAAKTADEDKVVAKVIENATMEIPDQMVEEQVNEMCIRDRFSAFSSFSSEGESSSSYS